MAPTSAVTTAVSAPGKVLLAGGYLVLDRTYTGLVFGLSARVHVGVQPLPTRAGVSLSEIIVRSPQFTDAEWRYGYRLAEDEGGIEVTQLKGSSTAALSRNVFVETALAYALTYISTLTPPHLDPAAITILADNDYYSQTASARSAKGGPFANFHVPLQHAHKTGLGSSAALVTAFAAAVLAHYMPAASSVSSLRGQSLVHNLAQAAHCAAQGKVGSGFDVAAAVYGSCIYKRFSPSVLEGMGEVGSKGFAKCLKAVVEGDEPSHRWDTQVTKESAKMPRGIRLVMCDVDCGSQTVGMVKQVLTWRANNPEESKTLWEELQAKNEELGRTLHELAHLERSEPEQFKDGLEQVARGGVSSPDTIWAGLYVQLEQTIARIRSLVRDMSSRSGVSIEPKPQTLLLDACSALPGVIGGVVPGAGGYDAVALLVVDEESVLSRLAQTLKDWRVPAEEGPSQSGHVRMLGVSQEMEGLKPEKGDLYIPWL